MILIYEATETDFGHNGLGALMPSTCYVTEEVNGRFELYMEHPIDDYGKWEKLQEQRIIKAPTYRGNQQFRIYNVFKDPITGFINVDARHTFYDLLDNLLEDVRPTVKTGEEAGQVMLDGCQFATAFNFTSDITGVSTAYYIRTNPVQAFIGNIDQAFINRWGGEIIRDNYNIAINSRIGADKGVRISYGKNLTGLELTLDMSGVYTRIMPTALDENGAVITTPQKYYDSPLIGNYPHPKIGVLNTKIRVGQKVNGEVPYPDLASAYAAMEEQAQAVFDVGVDKPRVSLNVRFIKWQDSEEYKAFTGLYSVDIGDDVTVQYKPFDIDVKLRVVEVEWDCIRKKANRLILGDKQPNITQTVVDMDIDLSAVNADISNLRGDVNGDISALSNDVAGKLDEGTAYNNVTFTHEHGILTSAVIDGVAIEVRQNAQDGFALYAAGEYVGGLKVISGQAVLVSNRLTNTLDSACYATIGKYVSDNETYRGIFIYNTAISSTVPALRIVTNGDSGYSTYQILDKSGEPRIEFDTSGGMYLHDSSGNAKISFDLFGTALWHGDKGIGVDSGGAYKIVGGTQTYL